MENIRPCSPLSMRRISLAKSSFGSAQICGLTINSANKATSRIVFLIPNALELEEREPASI